MIKCGEWKVKYKGNLWKSKKILQRGKNRYYMLRGFNWVLLGKRARKHRKKWIILGGFVFKRKHFTLCYETYKFRCKKCNGKYKCLTKGIVV